MAASLGPSWSLRTNNASPRCLTVYATTPAAGGSTATHHGTARKSKDPATAAAAGYSVTVGTERGSLHYRNYPPLLTADSSFDGAGGGSGSSSRVAGGGRGGHRTVDPSQLCIEPTEQINLQGAVKGSIVNIVHAQCCYHSPSETATTIASNAASSPVFLLLVDDDRGTATFSSTTTAGMSAGSTMLSTSTSSQKQHNSGAYAAHLVTARNGTFHKLPPYGADTTTSSMSTSSSDGITKNKPTTGTAASASTAAHQQSPRLGRKIHNPPNSANNLKDIETNNNTAQSSGVPLPRMSCAVHHPETGYVYAAGTGVYGLPNSAALAVMEGMALTMMSSHSQQHYRHDDDEDDDDDYHNYTQQQQQPRRHHPPPSSSGVHHPTPYSTLPTPSSSTSILKPLPPTALYLNCHHALPMPGVRCSSSGGHQNMTLACVGRVAIVAVANAFYAVPAYLNMNAIKSIAATSASGGNSLSSTSTVIPTPVVSTLPNVTATKIASFAQSSQVHPVLAVEIVMSSPPITTTMTQHDRSSLPTLEGVMSKYIRSVTSLVFLASGRECTTVEITSIPDNSALAATGGNGTGGEGNKGAGGARSQSAVIASSSIGDGMVLSTTIKSMSHSKIHGMATLPSPILAAATLPPVRQSTNGGGGLSSGPLIALLTVDGLVHVRSPLCYAVPLTSLEVGTRLNDYFTLSPLQALPSFHELNVNNSNSRENRTIVATSYGGESRLISIHDTESSQDFADRLMRLCIDAFGSNGFPRLELAESLGATFLATSYGGSGGGGVQQELSSSSMTTTTLMQYHQKRTLLKQYLECVLGLSDDIRARVISSSSAVVTASKLESISHVSVVLSDGQEGGDVEVEAIDRDYEAMDERAIPTSASSLGANALLTCTALLCLVSFQLSPPDGSTAVRASRACASAVGIVLRPNKDTSFSSSSGIVSKTAVTVCELVADRLLKEVSSTLSSNFSLLTASSSVSNSSTSWGNRASLAAATMEFVETAIWLLRSCGCHEKAINVLQERMNSPAFRNASMGDSLGGSSSIGGGSASSTGGGGGWSQIKFDSYLTTHLGELWSSNDDQCRQLVLVSSATRDLIARNPTLGLSIFTTIHPRNETEWKMMKPEDDPLVHPLYPMKVVELLKSISPQQSSGGGGGGVDVHHEPGAIECLSSFSPWSQTLPLNSGRALAVSYLESAIGIATGRQPTNASSSPDTLTSPSSYRTESSRDEIDERKADVHDELSYLLLEGVISERGDDDGGVDSTLGAIYRFKLRRLLSWPDSRIRSERLLSALPLSFLREHALLLGRLGRHEDALQILYFQEKSLDLALEYCDVRHERQQAQMEDAKASGAAPGRGPRGRATPNQCAYIPLVKVALSMDPDIDRGSAAAIKVLALRRDRIDKAAVVRLLPKNTPMQSLVRPFLIPAVVEDESQVRRLTIASSLLRSRMIQLKKKLVEAQLESQASLHSSPALQRLNLGALLHSSKSVAARPVHAASPHYPDVLLTKHFFPRHLVIQAQVTNNPAKSMADQNYARTLANVAFVIAESSDDALVPTMELPLKTLPHKATGSAWCVIAANPQRLDGAAFLTCELRFTVLTVDADTGMPLKFSESINSSIGLGQTFVEELHDIEVRHTEFG